jgi:hypothetical protein
LLLQHGVWAQLPGLLLARRKAAVHVSDWPSSSNTVRRNMKEKKVGGKGEATGAIFDEL